MGHYLGYRIRLHRYPLDSGVAAKPPLLAHRKLARMQHDVGDRFIKRYLAVQVRKEFLVPECLSSLA